MSKRQNAEVSMLKKIQKREYICLVFVLLIFTLMSLYKLTDAPLWYDEMIEFYYSKYLTGPIRGVSPYQNLYERLQYNSFQPPLYNLIMYVWLLFGESEWWIRFAGVVFSVIGMMGLYACLKLITDWKVACLAVFINSFIYEMMYYVKEAAEYNMMIMLLYWMLYLYFRAFKDLSLKNVGAFTAISVVLLYTQYGAVLAIIPLAVCLFLRGWRMGKKELCGKIGLMYVLTGAIAGGLLYFFLFRIQLAWNQSVNYYTVAFEKDNVLYDFVMMLLTTAQWLFTESKTRFFLEFAAALPVFVGLCIWCVRKRKNPSFLYFLSGNIAIWLIYYGIVRSGIYAYGDFGNRYSLFLLPVWVVLIFYVGYETFQTVKMYEFPYKKWILRSGSALLLAVQLGYCVYGFYRVTIYEGKSNTRAVVNLWYEREGYKLPTYVVFGEAPSFTYYLTHDERFEEDYWDNIVFEYENKEGRLGTEEYWNYLKEMFGGQVPEEFYLSIGHDFELTDALQEQGYRMDEVYRTNTILYHVSRP